MCIRDRIRQACRGAFAAEDCSQRVQRALVRKAAPLRGKYSVGDLREPKPRKPNGVLQLVSSGLMATMSYGDSVMELLYVLPQIKLGHVRQQKR